MIRRILLPLTCSLLIASSCRTSKNVELTMSESRSADLKWWESVYEDHFTGIGKMVSCLRLDSTQIRIVETEWDTSVTDADGSHPVKKVTETDLFSGSETTGNTQISISDSSRAERDISMESREQMSRDSESKEKVDVRTKSVVNPWMLITVGLAAVAAYIYLRRRKN